MLSGKNILVTGAAGGIGSAIVSQCLAAGAKVWAQMRVPRTEEVPLLGELSGKYGDRLHTVYFDLKDDEAVKSSLRAANQESGGFYGLVNCAGMAHGGFFAMTPIAQIREVMGVNLFAPMLITQHIMRGMVRQRSGSIVNISSIAGEDLETGNSAYGVSKAALSAWTKTLASELAAQGVRVNAVAPGPTETRMAEAMDAKALERMLQASFMKRLAKPEEIAKTVVFLLSEQSSFITGQVLRVDGGRA